MTKLALFVALALAGPATAQTRAPAPVCPRDAEPVPPALAAWRMRTPLMAARDAVSLALAEAKLGAGYDLTLAPNAGVTYPARPTRPGAMASHGGMVKFTVRDAGTYRVAIGAGAWLDVVRDGVALPSRGHAHGPACSGIRKMVDFALKPGGYTLQIVGNAEAKLQLLILRIG